MFGMVLCVSQIIGYFIQSQLLFSNKLIYFVSFDHHKNNYNIRIITAQQEYTLIITLLSNFYRWDTFFAHILNYLIMHLEPFDGVRYATAYCL
jgi:hypothetical protein